MKVGIFIRTIRFLKVSQIIHQVLYRLFRSKYIQIDVSRHSVIELSALPIPRNKGVNGESFSFINLKHQYVDWNYTGKGTLYTYNLNYFDFINADGISKDEACYWIDKWIKDTPIITLGMDPYPIALRGVNWIKFFFKYPECATKEREESLWSQYHLLFSSLEYHLLGNHLLEDAFSLYVGALYFQDKELLNKSSKLLIGQLKEQTLLDGAHFEQSPMYHCILLDRLLDCINVGMGANNSLVQELKEYAIKQLGWLKSICYKDGTFPLFNDAAYGIAPSPQQIFDYASRLGVEFDAIPLGESGYRKMYNGHIEAIVDVGNITATYQPGHSHADTLSYELRIDGVPVVVDTGVSTYDKNERRQYERSTAAHNCVVVDGHDSSEVWAGFRVGNRCTCTVVKDESNIVEAYHNGYKNKCFRRFILQDDAFVVEDRYLGNAVSYIHLAPDVNIERICFEGAKHVEIFDEKMSVEYNRFVDIKVIKISFDDCLKYIIK